MEEGKQKYAEVGIPVGLNRGVSTTAARPGSIGESSASRRAVAPIRPDVDDEIVDDNRFDTLYARNEATTVARLDSSYSPRGANKKKSRETVVGREKREKRPPFYATLYEPDVAPMCAPRSRQSIVRPHLFRFNFTPDYISVSSGRDTPLLLSLSRARSSRARHAPAINASY